MLAREGVSDTAALLCGAATLTVTAVTAFSYAYKEHELEKVKEYFEAITKLFKQYLDKEPAPGYKPPPPIFSNGTPENPTPTTSIQIEVLEDLYNLIPIYNDPHLRDYGHHVLNAMRSIAKYYDWRLTGRNWFWRGKKTDLTSSVLSYIILMLSEHCVKFEGYAADIGLLHNLAEFTNAFASLERGLHDERFEHLTEAYNELLIAKAILVDHSTSLSVEEMIGEFESFSGSVAERMIRLSAKFILPNKNWKEVGFASIDRIAEGVISPKYKNGRSLSHFFFGGATLLPDTVLSEWVQQNAKDYIDSLPVNKGHELTIESQKFKMLNKTEPAYKEKLKKIKAAFKASTNVLTLTVKGKKKSDATKEFTPVTTDEDVEHRAEVFFNFYELTDRVIVAQYLCSHLWRQIKQLGEIYVTESHHCDFIFQVLEGLGKQIDEMTAKISHDLQQIELSFAGAMQENDANVLLTELKDLLTASKAVSNSINAIVKKHNGRRKATEIKLPVNLDRKDKLLSLTYEISKAYKINTGHPVLSTEAGPAAGAAEEEESLDPERPGPEFMAKLRRREDPAVGKLYAAIYQMRSYGQSLLAEDDTLGQVAVTLANRLEDKTDEFYSRAAPPDRETLYQFKREFNELLHSKDKEMATHREAWKPIVANIALALTGLGLLAIAAKLLFSGSFFFAKTGRQEQVEQVEASVKNIGAPAA